MTAHDPRVTLTEAERTRLRMTRIEGPHGAHLIAGPELGGAWLDALAEQVERIVAARLAPIRALAEVWTYGYSPGTPSQLYADALRAALDAPVSASQDHDGAEGQGEGEEAREGDLCAAECGKRVDRTIPNPIPEGFELMWSESMTGRALYCQACFDKPDPEES